MSAEHEEVDLSEMTEEERERYEKKQRKRAKKAAAAAAAAAAEEEAAAAAAAEEAKPSKKRKHEVKESEEEEQQQEAAAVEKPKKNKSADASSSSSSSASSSSSSSSIKKHFYKAPASLASFSKEDVEAFRATHCMAISGNGAAYPAFKVSCASSINCEHRQCPAMFQSSFHFPPNKTIKKSGRRVSNGFTTFSSKCENIVPQA